MLPSVSEEGKLGKGRLIMNPERQLIIRKSKTYWKLLRGGEEITRMGRRTMGSTKTRYYTTFRIIKIFPT